MEVRLDICLKIFILFGNQLELEINVPERTRSLSEVCLDVQFFSVNRPSRQTVETLSLAISQPLYLLFQQLDFRSVLSLELIELPCLTLRPSL